MSASCEESIHKAINLFDKLTDGYSDFRTFMKTYPIESKNFGQIEKDAALVLISDLCSYSSQFADLAYPLWDVYESRFISLALSVYNSFSRTKELITSRFIEGPSGTYRLKLMLEFYFADKDFKSLANLLHKLDESADADESFEIFYSKSS
jgi:hypothetical protein